MIFSIIVKRMGGYNGLRKHFESKSSLKRRICHFILQGFQHETNSYLPFDCKINGPINFIHGAYGIFISGGAKIGKNCMIFQQVTIGSNMLIDSKGLGSPTIGDNCLIGAGAKIIGNVTIGNNCRIGANAVVTVDLPDNSVCVMNKPIILSKEKIENKIYTNTASGWGYFKDGQVVLEENENIIQMLNHNLFK